MQNVKLQKADFANKYFYIFGLNLKFCKGIRNYKAKLSEKELTEQSRKEHIIRHHVAYAKRMTYYIR